jgi:hypothetical protein
LLRIEAVENLIDFFIIRQYYPFSKDMDERFSLLRQRAIADAALRAQRFADIDRANQEAQDSNPRNQDTRYLLGKPRKLIWDANAILALDWHHGGHLTITEKETTLPIDLKLTWYPSEVFPSHEASEWNEMNCRVARNQRGEIVGLRFNVPEDGSPEEKIPIVDKDVSDDELAQVIEWAILNPLIRTGVNPQRDPNRRNVGLNDDC